MHRKRQLETLKHKWEVHVKKDFKEMNCGHVDCIKVVQDRGRWRAFMKTLIYLWVTRKAVNGFID